MKMYAFGHTTQKTPINGDGLRYQGCSPILSRLRHLGYIDTVAYPADEKHLFGRALTFLRTEGFLPAPESASSVCCASDQTLKCRERGERKVITFNVSGHGFMDIEDYSELLGFDAEPAHEQKWSHPLGI